MRKIRQLPSARPDPTCIAERLGQQPAADFRLVMNGSLLPFRI